jgi:hypothetical protein
MEAKDSFSLFQEKSVQGFVEISFFDASILTTRFSVAKIGESKQMRLANDEVL